MSDYKVYLLNPTTKDIAATFDTVADLQKATGCGNSSVYRRLRGEVTTPAKLNLNGVKGEYEITNKPPKALKAANPNAEYIVTDGTLVFHKGKLAECKAMAAQIGLKNLKTQLWQNK